MAPSSPAEFAIDLPQRYEDESTCLIRGNAAFKCRLGKPAPGESLDDARGFPAMLFTALKAVCASADPMLRPEPT